MPATVHLPPSHFLPLPPPRQGRNVHQRALTFEPKLRKFSPSWPNSDHTISLAFSSACRQWAGFPSQSSHKSWCLESEEAQVQTPEKEGNHSPKGREGGTSSALLRICFVFQVQLDHTVRHIRTQWDAQKCLTIVHQIKMHLEQTQVHASRRRRAMPADLNRKPLRSFSLSPDTLPENAPRISGTCKFRSGRRLAKSCAVLVALKISSLLLHKTIA